MDTEETTTSKSKKFLKITLAMVAVLALLLGVAYILTTRKNTKQAEAPNVTPAKKEPTEAEKLLRSQVEELDKLRVQNQSATQATTTLKSQVKSMDALRVKQKQATVSAPKTIEEQIREMDALRTVAN